MSTVDGFTIALTCRNYKSTTTTAKVATTPIDQTAARMFDPAAEVEFCPGTSFVGTDILSSNACFIDCQER